MYMELPAWKVSKYGVISSPYFPVFGMNPEIYFVRQHNQLMIQNQKMQTQQVTFINNVFWFIFRRETRKIIPSTNSMGLPSDKLRCNKMPVCSFGKISWFQELRSWLNLLYIADYVIKYQTNFCRVSSKKGYMSDRRQG